MRPRMSRLALGAVLLLATGCSAMSGARKADPMTDLSAAHSADAAVRTVLDDFHAAASEADGDRYFGHFAPGGVFVGTDATERWTVDEFRAYAEPYFSEGKGWTYVAVERHVTIARDGATAWFDERLENESYGETRGSGVLRRIDGAWRIEQYVLSFPVPNDVAKEVVELIRAHESRER